MGFAFCSLESNVHHIGTVTMRIEEEPHADRDADPQRNITATKPAIVVLGGNAFAKRGRPLTMKGQFEFAQDVSQKLVSLCAEDRPLVVTHGNGPQVGHMLSRVEAAAGEAYRLPLEVCVAETEGELGYVLQQSLHNVLHEADIARQSVSLLTQVVVDNHDPAFDTPTKPVGPVLTAQQAADFESRGVSVIEDYGRGLRRVVPSPEPVEIIETDIICNLLKEGVVVIAAGGGGIPVIRTNGRLHGVNAVVDKDLASALLGERIGAVLMVTVTDVPCAYCNFRSASQTEIGKINVDDAGHLINEGHFGVGSMLPKIEAARRFCRRGGTRAVICSPENLHDALTGDAGTIVVGPAKATDLTKGTT